MTQLFNQRPEKQKRQQLRNMIPDCEIIVWSQLKGKQFFGHKFRRQCSIGRYVVDFYCPRQKLVIEIDGDSHFTDEAKKYDKVREEYIKALGLRIIRFTNHEIRTQLPNVLEAIRQALTNL